jgi:hypothetical protein
VEHDVPSGENLKVVWAEFLIHNKINECTLPMPVNEVCSRVKKCTWRIGMFPLVVAYFFCAPSEYCYQGLPLFSFAFLVFPEFTN